MQRNKSMKYFKNTEAASIYKVSEKSVRNWIVAAQSGKLDLELYQHGEKFYIANTVNNDVAIKALVARGQKYKNSRGRITVKPDRKFYSVYNPRQIFDILSSLDIHREIPLQYTYVEEGAEHWDLYTKRLEQEKKTNTLNATIELLKDSSAHLDLLLDGVKRVNVIDLGTGNALPVKAFLQELKNRDILSRYIGLDISEEMLKIASKNLNEWFGDDIVYETHLKDINYNHFEHLIAEDAFTSEEEKTSNIVLLLGGTLSNMRTPTRVLQLVNDSMGRNDLIMYSLKLDSENSRRYFNLDAMRQSSKLNPQLGYVLNLLNIPEDSYDAEYIFDKDRRARFVYVVMNTDVSIEFEIGTVTRLITLKKGEKVGLWRARHQTTLEVFQEFENAGFDLLHASKTPDQEYLFTISKVKNEIS